MANEKRLIDANALSKCIKEGSGTELQKFFADVCVATAPTVDAVEVKHGRWHEVDGETEWECHYRCSKCFTRSYELTNYCPNCGAKMDGDGNGS